MLPILIGGFFLRAHLLGQKSFWLDEAYTWGVVVNTDWRSVWGAMLAVSDVSPLYYVITKAAAPAFGTTEFGLRLTSVLAGWLAIAVVYRLGRAALNSSAAVLGAAIIALSPFAVWYSQDARPYALYLLSAALALLFFWRAESSARWRDWLPFIFFSGALYLTHYVGALYAYAQAAYVLTQLRRQPTLFRRWIGAQAVAALPTAGWLFLFLAQRRPLTGHVWIPAVTIFTPLQTLWNFASGDAAQPTPLVVFGGLALALVIALAIFTHRRVRRVQMLAWWLAAMSAGWLFSLRLPAYVDRYFEPGIMSAALLFGAGLILMPRAARMAAIPVVLLGLFAASIRLSVDPQFAKEDWRGAARLLDAANITVGLPDAESQLGLSPYLSPRTRLAWVGDGADLSARLAEGRLALVLRSPYESAHALSKSTSFDPFEDGPAFFRRWRSANADAPMTAQRFAGLALVIIGQ